jgi:protein tyrosine/serine phosphatase
LNRLSAYCNQKLKKGLRFIIANNGPYLIHCFAGIDRTGFVAAVLEALMGASIHEIVDDYLLSFGGGNTSAYTADEWEIEDVYSKDRILSQLNAINNETEITDKNIQSAVEQYLLDDLGLSKDELALLKNKLKSRWPMEE